MIPYQLIRRKRDGGELTPDEIRHFFTGYAAGTVADYQVSAFLMAVYHHGLSPAELNALVETILHSGARVDLSAISGAKVDKHSTGGVGDKVSIVLAPLIASLGIAVPMMSGRGLGHTGGTVDKLESIPGFRAELTIAQVQRQLAAIGCALITQSEEITPLDKKLYALRDVTATVESIPLIAASIMSKKIAEGIDALLLDVKRGSGAFIPELERGLQLARTMIQIGEAHGCRTVALLTAMDRPLGWAVGNALEIEEAVLVMNGAGPDDLRELTLAQAEELVLLARGGDRGAVRREVGAALADGRALQKFREVVEAQGGNAQVVTDPALLPQAKVRAVVDAPRTGIVLRMDTRAIGEAAVALGAGRAVLSDAIDPAVGFHITAKPGQPVVAGEPIATIFARDQASAGAARVALHAAIEIGDGGADSLPLISHRVTTDGVEELSK